MNDKEVQVASAQLKKIVDNIETVIIGKRKAVELVVLSMIAKGHVLIEDVPGVGKTSLVSALAKSIDCDFSRIQFTPDLMPSDITGFSIFNQKSEEFEFRPGGIMSNLVLADEINRATAKTQSALLEAMEERQVSVDSNTYPLEEPFMVLATQNPVEQFGTYPLPEAQLDRFLIKLSIGYPDFREEAKVVALGDSAKKVIQPVASAQDVIALREKADNVFISPKVIDYLVELTTTTRNNPEISLGASPRGGLALKSLSKAYALYLGRDYVIPDDIRFIAPFVLGHRIILAHEAKVQGRTADDVIGSIVGSVAIPLVSEEDLRQ